MKYKDKEIVFQMDNETIKSIKEYLPDHWNGKYYIIDGNDLYIKEAMKSENLNVIEVANDIREKYDNSLMKSIMVSVTIVMSLLYLILGIFVSQWFYTVVPLVIVFMYLITKQVLAALDSNKKISFLIFNTINIDVSRWGLVEIIESLEKEFEAIGKINNENAKHYDMLLKAYNGLRKDVLSKRLDNIDVVDIIDKHDDIVASELKELDPYDGNVKIFRHSMKFKS